MLMNMNVIPSIRPMSYTDVDKVVDVHLKSFSGFLLSYLGENFLKHFYSSFVKDCSAIAYVLVDEPVFIGFVVGSSQAKGLNKRLLKRKWLQFGLAAFPAVLSKPRVIPRLLRAISLPSQKMPVLNCGTLMSIAVSPEYQGKGGGSRLVQTFLEESKSRGLDAVNLKTDAVDYDAVNHFYKKWVSSCSVPARRRKVG